VCYNKKQKKDKLPRGAKESIKNGGMIFGKQRKQF
jgi:hypothetical protein